MLRTGKEHIESLRDGRIIYIGNERVDDVTTHPAFRNPARMEARDAIAAWSRLTYGWMGRSPDYKADAAGRSKLMKLLWDALGTEFGGRHELYEINYGGSTEEIRRYCLFGAQASGNADKFKGFAEECMAEYDLDGWKVPDLSDPGELSYHVMRGTK